MVSIKDVAKKANVSVATVSHVINKTRFVSEELTNKVLDTIEKLDYYPDRMAGSLRSKRTSTIGLVMPDSSNLLFSALAKKIEDLLFLNNYNTIFCNSDYDSNKEMEIINNLRSKKVDGILIVPVDKDDKNTIKLEKSKTPTIILDRKSYKTGLATITIDNESGIYKATKHLIELGHRAIGYIDRKKPHTHSIDRLKGYKKALKESGIKINDKYIKKGGFKYEDGYNAAKVLIENNPGLTAIINFNDIAAMGAARAMVDLGMKIPGDISIIGFDDIVLCQYYNPRLTSIHYPFESVAESATDILIDLIQKKHPTWSKELIIPPRLVIRESTGPAK